MLCAYCAYDLIWPSSWIHLNSQRVPRSEELGREYVLMFQVLGKSRSTSPICSLPCQRGNVMWGPIPMSLRCCPKSFCRVSNPLGLRCQTHPGPWIGSRPRGSLWARSAMWGAMQARSGPGGKASSLDHGTSSNGINKGIFPHPPTYIYTCCWQPFPTDSVAGNSVVEPGPCRSLTGCMCWLHGPDLAHGPRLWHSHTRAYCPALSWLWHWFLFPIKLLSPCKKENVGRGGEVGILSIEREKL